MASASALRVTGLEAAYSRQLALEPVPEQSAEVGLLEAHVDRAAEEDDGKAFGKVVAGMSAALRQSRQFGCSRTFFFDPYGKRTAGICFALRRVRIGAGFACDVGFLRSGAPRGAQE